MGALAPVLGVIGKVAAVGGTILQVAGTMQAGREEKARLQYEEKVQEQQADEALAASQRDAASRYREGRLLLSQQRAAIAGSGGNITDASVIDLMGDTAAEADLAARTEIYKGEQQSRGYNDAAKVAGVNADNAMRRARWQAAGQLFSGVSSMYSRFGQQAKATTPSTSSNAIYG